MQALPQITVKNLHIVVEGDKAVATFQSAYRSPKYSDYGSYRLEFVKESGPWKIVSEQWVESPIPPGPHIVGI